MNFIIIDSTLIRTDYFRVTASSILKWRRHRRHPEDIRTESGASRPEWIIDEAIHSNRVPPRPKGEQQVTGKAPPPAHPPKRIVSRETGAALSTCCIIQQFDSDSSGRGEPFQLTRTSFCISAVYLFQQIEQTGNGAFTAEIRPSIERDGREIPRMSPHWWASVNYWPCTWFALTRPVFDALQREPLGRPKNVPWNLFALTPINFNSGRSIEWLNDYITLQLILLCKYLYLSRPHLRGVNRALFWPTWRATDQLTLGTKLN